MEVEIAFEPIVCASRSVHLTTNLWLVQLVKKTIEADQ